MNIGTVVETVLIWNHFFSLSLFHILSPTCAEYAFICGGLCQWRSPWCLCCSKLQGSPTFMMCFSASLVLHFLSLYLSLSPLSLSLSLLYYFDFHFFFFWITHCLLYGYVLIRSPMWKMLWISCTPRWMRRLRRCQKTIRNEGNTQWKYAINFAHLLSLISCVPDPLRKDDACYMNILYMKQSSLSFYVVCHWCFIFTTMLVNNKWNFKKKKSGFANVKEITKG